LVNTDLSPRLGKTFLLGQSPCFVAMRLGHSGVVMSKLVLIGVIALMVIVSLSRIDQQAPATTAPVAQAGGGGK
jgi:hypothetical protein